MAILLMCRIAGPAHPARTAAWLQSRACCCHADGLEFVLSRTGILDIS